MLEYLYKDCCDHCGEIVDKRWWTFDLEQCVVCDDPDCKAKQKIILNKVMDDCSTAMIERLKRGESMF